MKKKVLIVTNHSYMLWQFRRELIGSLLEKYQVSISTPFVGHEADFARMGCHMIQTDLERRGMNPLHDAKLIGHYKQILQDEDPDFVITYSIKPNIYMGSLCAKLGIPYAVNVQGLGTAFQNPKLRFVVSKMYHHACRKAKCVFFENQSNADFFVNNRIVRKDTVVVLPGAGVNLDQYAYTPYMTHDDHKFHFLYLGRIMREKGITELFDAAEQLYQTNPNFVLDIAGFYEDEYKQRVEDLVNKGIAHFYGFQKNPVPFYQQADCVMNPSYHEGMSNVLLEAASIGRVVIATDIPGCRESVENGRTGYLVKPKDTASLLHAMETVLSLSEHKLSEMGMDGHLKMENEFNRYKVVKQVMEACGL